MPEISTHLKMPYINASQAQKFLTHNHALRILDHVVNLAVSRSDLTSPPSFADPDETFLIADNATGEWSGRDGQIAAYDYGLWMYHTPQAGWKLFDKQTHQMRVFDGTNWISLSANLDNTIRLGIGGVADNFERLVVKTDQARWTYIDKSLGGLGNCVHIIEKQDTIDRAGFEFYSSDQKYAYFGSDNSNDIVITTQDQNNNSKIALSINSQTAQVDQPNLPRVTLALSQVQTIASDIWTTVRLNETLLDPLNCANTSNFEIIIPQAGTYLIGATIMSQISNTPPTAINGRIIKNQTDTLAGTQSAVHILPSADKTSWSTQTLITLNVGDRIKLEVKLDTESSDLSPNDCQLWTYKIG